MTIKEAKQAAVTAYARQLRCIDETGTANPSQVKQSRRALASDTAKAVVTYAALAGIDPIQAMADIQAEQ